MLLSRCCAGSILPDQARLCNRDFWGNSTKLGLRDAAGVLKGLGHVSYRRPLPCGIMGLCREATMANNPSKTRRRQSMMAMLKKVWNCLKRSYVEYVRMLYSVQH